MLFINLLLVLSITTALFIFKFSYGLFIFLIIYFAFYIFLGKILFQHSENPKTHYEVLMAIIFASFALILISFFVPKNYLIDESLCSLGLIQTKEYANWYTIDPKYYSLISTDKNELNDRNRELYADLIPSDNNNSKLYWISQCDAIEVKANQINEQKNKCLAKAKSYQAKNDFNRFYGYLIWNTESKVVFCPYTFSKEKVNNKDSVKCLAIDSSYLKKH